MLSEKCGREQTEDLKLRQAFGDDNIQKLIGGAGIRAEHEAASLVSLVHGSGKIDFFKGHGSSVIHGEDHPFRRLEQKA